MVAIYVQANNITTSLIWWTYNTKYFVDRNAYKGMEDDIMWFGQRSIDPVTFTIKEAGKIV